MARREAVVTLAALAAIGVVSVLAYRSGRGPVAGACQICQRALHPGVTYRVDAAERSELACCPRCGMHSQIARPKDLHWAWATDLASGEWVAAESASYVECGNVEYCTAGERPAQREPQEVSVRDYDRCLPTLVAFKDPNQAALYQSRHGGRILDFQQALESVRGR